LVDEFGLSIKTRGKMRAKPPKYFWRSISRRRTNAGFDHDLGRITRATADKTKAT
jgi:hypothetical protein